jgi:NAD-dependent SIR2 family protein deacetylase
MTASLPALVDLVRRSRRIVAVTGAGCSTASGIPDYRDEAGDWKRKPPVAYRDFVRGPRVRQRYWARSLAGWPAMADARPNGAHDALARLEREGRVDCVVTQNVDGLHQAAGSRAVIDLHGRIDAVRCLGCGAVTSRALFQEDLLAANPSWRGVAAPTAPDGDADLEAQDLASFVVPDCALCHGILKPDVVFFGESVPPARVEEAYAAVRAADLLLVVGTSLMVFSGYRFARAAAAANVPVALVNLGRTRADDLAAVKVAAPAAETLDRLADEVEDTGDARPALSRTRSAGSSPPARP